jgi:hypothetical protein
LLGAFFRFWANATVNAFGLTYVSFYNQTERYAIIYAFIGLFGGIFSNMFYAVLADKLEPRFSKIKSHLATI